MPVIGIGVDIVALERFAKTGPSQHRLAQRILTPEELAAWQQSQQPAAFLGKRFAAKEAAVKALGTGIGQGVSFQDLQITHDQLGKPLLNYSGVFAELAAQRQVRSAFLSISDEKSHAVAMVVLES